ncbi:MAG: hypothetical protein KY445_06725 [Armatimonadetes bacterium]|nr:hypothetical protein [Armatimonadota bacterium]
MDTPNTGSNTSRPQTGGVVDDVKHKAGEVIGQAQQKAAPVLDEAQQKAKSKLEQGKERAAVELGSVAHALHKTGEQLQQGDQKAAGEYTVQAADRLEQISTHLHESSVQQLVGEVEDFARREPTLFMAGAFAVGVLGARFLKSSKQGPLGRRSSQRVSPEALALPETVTPVPRTASTTVPATTPTTARTEAEASDYRAGAATSYRSGAEVL